MAAGTFTIANMQQGIDEDGRRIKIHTSALTSACARILVRI